MPLPLETHRIESLKKLARERYGELTEAESGILQRSASDEDFQVADSNLRPDVHADFLRWLATDKEAAGLIDPLGIRVNNANISSFLDLNHVTIAFPLQFQFCTFAYEVYLSFAQLPALEFVSCTIESIRAFGLTVSGYLNLSLSTIRGTVYLNAAHIGGNLECSGTQFTGTSDRDTGGVLSVEGGRIGGTVFLNAASPSTGNFTFSSAGTISLAGTNVDGQLNCEGAKFTAPTALIADAARFSHVFFRSKYYREDGIHVIPFSANGVISLREAEITGDLDCLGAERLGELRCDRMRVGSIIYLNIQFPQYADLQLFNVTASALHDDEMSWPSKNHVALDGFVYQELILHRRMTDEQIVAFEPAPVLKLNARQRIEWLRRQKDDDLDNAQPWMQVAKMFESAGDVEGSRHVVYEFHRWRARNSFWRPFSFLYDQIGEQPLRIAAPIALFWGIGSLVFWRAHRMGAMMSTEKVRADAGEGKEPGSGRSTPFYPAVYVLENVLPVVKLGQDAAWTPDPQAQGTWLPEWTWLDGVRRWAAKWRLTRWMVRLNYPRLELLRWTLILVGWALALILAAAIGEQFKR